MSAAHAMRRRDARQVWESRFGPNLTPMVDVVMVILVFFMAAAVFAGPEWFHAMALADKQSVRGGAVDTLPTPVLPVRIQAEGRNWRIEGFGYRGTSPQDFAARVGAWASDLDGDDVLVVIEPDAGVPWGLIVGVQDACVAAGLSRVGLTPQ